MWLLVSAAWIMAWVIDFGDLGHTVRNGNAGCFCGASPSIRPSHDVPHFRCEYRVGISGLQGRTGLAPTVHPPFDDRMAVAVGTREHGLVHDKREREMAPGWCRSRRMKQCQGHLGNGEYWETVRRLETKA